MLQSGCTMVEQLLGQAVQLNPADPNNITIAVEIAQALSHIFSVYTLQARSVLPMVLSAAAELHEHLDSSFCKVISTPIWSNIHPDDPRSQDSPLYPLSIHYGKVLLPPPFPPATGPSALNAALPLDPDVPAGKGKGKEKAHPEDEPADDRKRSHPHTMSARSHSRVPKAKHQRTTSKAMITSEDEWELDIAPIAEQPPTTRNKLPLATRLPPGVKLPPALKGSCQCRKSVSMVVVTSNNEGTQAVPQPAVTKAWKGYVEIAETDEETPMNIGHAPRMGTAYVEIPPAPKVTKAVPAITTTVAVDLAEDDHANLTSEVWLPGCGSCVQKALVCRQDYNATGGELTVCACCHCSKHKCSELRKPQQLQLAAHVQDLAINLHWCMSPQRQTQPLLQQPLLPVHLYRKFLPHQHCHPALSAPSPECPPHPSLPPPFPPLLFSLPPLLPPQPQIHWLLPLRVKVATLQTMVASLEEKVSCGEKLLLEANRRLAEQEASSKLLATQFEQLHRELLPPNLPSPAEVCLPVIVGNSRTVADGVGPVALALCNVEAEATAQSASVVSALGNVEAEGATESTSVASTTQE
ncbi:hypothetical protein EDB19DRAFT_1834606 [Suillus lakei]|nr:hypothetical protein EDB19DRAFT_1834606 [Suillus lakei]